MAEFNFLAVPEDSVRILDAIMSPGNVWAGRDIPQDAPQVPWIKESRPDIRHAVNQKDLLLLWLPGVSKQLEFFQMDKGPYAGKFYVQKAYTGPVLYWLPPAFFEQNEKNFLNFGSLYYPPRFFDRGQGQEVAQPDPLKATYADLVKVIKSHCRRYGPKKHWAGEHAFGLLERGEAYVYEPQRASV